MIGIAFLFPLSFGTFDVGGDFILRGMERRLLAGGEQDNEG